MSSLLEVKGLSYSYPGHTVLDSVEFTAESGEFIVVMGVNGAGKSTMSRDYARPIPVTLC
jgi:ABC-type multidrug transport system ATPase subunit